MHLRAFFAVNVAIAAALGECNQQRNSWKLSVGWGDGSVVWGGLQNRTYPSMITLIPLSALPQRGLGYDVRVTGFWVRGFLAGRVDVAGAAALWVGEGG